MAENAAGGLENLEPEFDRIARQLHNELSPAPAPSGQAMEREG